MNNIHWAVLKKIVRLKWEYSFFRQSKINVSFFKEQ